jgi:hypothetical protein
MKWRPVSPSDVSATRPPDRMALNIVLGCSRLAVWDDTDGPISLVWLHPPYTTNDRMYVRETWRALAALDPVAPRNFSRHDRIHYEADGEPRGFGWSKKARPSIHMPHKLARIWLDVVDVRPERVADLSDDEARREGFESPDEFRAAWTKICGWDERAWWWRIGFKRVEVSDG